MTVNAGKTCCADQMSFRGTSRIGLYLDITTFSGKSQIGDIHLVPTLSHTHQEILRLNVAMDDILGVNKLKTMEKLVSKHHHSLEGEPATAKIEKVLQTRSQKIEDHSIIFAFEQIIVNAWNTDTASKRSIDIDFSFEEGWTFIDVFEFNGDLFAVIEADS